MTKNDINMLTDFLTSLLGSKPEQTIIRGLVQSIRSGQEAIYLGGMDSTLYVKAVLSNDGNITSYQFSDKPILDIKWDKMMEDINKWGSGEISKENGWKTGDIYPIGSGGITGNKYTTTGQKWPTTSGISGNEYYKYYDYIDKNQKVSK